MVIKIIIEKKERQIVKITFFGHSNYDTYGKDIVCSAVSAIVNGSANFFIKENKKEIDILNNNSKIVILVKKNNDCIQILLKFMIFQLKNISIFFPHQISIKKERFLTKNKKWNLSKNNII